MLLKALPKWSKTSPVLLYNPEASVGFHSPPPEPATRFLPWTRWASYAVPRPLAETAGAYDSPLFWLPPCCVTVQRLALSNSVKVCHMYTNSNRIGGVIVSVLASSAVGRVFAPRSGQTKDYTIGICCFSAKHAALTLSWFHSDSKCLESTSGWKNSLDCNVKRRTLLLNWW